MRRAGRILYNLLTTISLLFFLLMTSLWIRSNWICDSLYWTDGSSHSNYFQNWELSCCRGKLRFGWYQFGHDEFTPGGRIRVGYSAQGTSQFRFMDDISEAAKMRNYRHYAVLGFELTPKFINRPYPQFDSRFFDAFTSFAIPLYFPTLLFTLLPAHYFLRTRRRRRQANRIAQGHCLTCNYDLRASPERCPECGAVPSVQCQ